MKTKLFTAVFAATLLLCTQADSSNADTTVQSFTNQHILESFVGPDATTNTTSPFDLSQTFNQFDPSLGNLDSITIEYEFEIWGIGKIGSSGGFIGGELNADLGWGGNVYGSDSGFGESLAGGPGDDASFGLDLAGSIVIDSSNPVLLSATVGTGTIDWTMEGLATMTGTAGNFDEGEMGPQADSVTVTYNYRAVPEPSGATLVAIAAISLAMNRRRRL